MLGSKPRTKSLRNHLRGEATAEIRSDEASCETDSSSSRETASFIPGAMCLLGLMSEQRQTQPEVSEKAPLLPVKARQGTHGAPRRCSGDMIAHFFLR